MKVQPSPSRGKRHESKTAEALSLKYNPVAIVWTDEKPADALQFKKGKWGCVMWMFAQAAKGKTAVFDRKAFGCYMGGTALGLGNQIEKFPFDLNLYYHFLSVGNAAWDEGKKAARQLKWAAALGIAPRGFSESFLEGERFKTSPELAQHFVENLPITEIAEEYVVFKPLVEIDPNDEKVIVVVLLVNPLQLSGLITLANCFDERVDNVIIPSISSCQAIGMYPYREAKSDHPRAVVGLTDLAARNAIRKQVGDDALTFAIPWKLYQEMESHVEESVLSRTLWGELRQSL